MDYTAGINIKLYPHQLNAIKLLEKFEYNRTIEVNNNNYPNIKQFLNTNVGIYADITGYGKTLSMLGYLCKWYLALRNDVNYLNPSSTIYTSTDVSKLSNNISLTTINNHEFNTLQQTLIVVNKQIANQWENELNHTELKYLSISLQKHIPDTIDKLCDYEIILCTNTMSKYLYKLVELYQWKRMIIDEPYENVIRERYLSDFYWLITASYQLMLYNFKTHGIHRNILPPSNYITNIVVMNDPEYIIQSYQLKPIEIVNHVIYEKSLANIAKSYISEEIAILLAGGNIKEAINMLGGTSPNVNIIDLVTRKKADELLEAEIKFSVYNRKFNIEKNSDFANQYYKWSDKVNRLKNDIIEIQNKFQSSISEGCNICCNDFEDNKIILLPCCQNIVCGYCLFGWFENNHHTCIYCRSDIDSSKLIYLEKNTIQLANTQIEPNSNKKIKIKIKNLTKLDVIVRLIRNRGNRKYIIVSYFNETFKPIKKYFELNNIPFVEFNGKKSEIDNKISKLINNEIGVVFLNGKHQGTGLNLQMMTDIILYHQIDDLTLTQIIGRIQRIGANEINKNIQHRLHKFIVK